MKSFYFVIIMASLLTMTGCRESGPSQPEERIVGLSNLVSDTYVHGDYKSIVVSAAPNISYGFDADATSWDVYLSVEAGKSNTIRVKGDYALRLTPGSGGLITSITESGAIKNVTAGGVPGSDQCKINLVVDDGGQEVLWDLTAVKDKNGNLPPNINVKIYNTTTLPTVNVYYLYGTTTKFNTLEDDLNRIYSQSVCIVEDVLTIAHNPTKPWDLNRNGKVDVYANSSDPNDESQEIVQWAGPGTSNQNYWNNDDLAVLVLDQPIEDHSGEGALGFRLQNCVVLGSDADITTAAHEYLHSPNVSSPPNGLRDVIDEFNLMNYTALGGQVLRYRPVTQYPSGTEPSQWQTLSKTTF